MNLFSNFVDFAQYLGTPKAALMVAAYFLGDFLLKKLPSVLDESARQNGNKFSNFLLYDFQLKRCPITFN